MEDNPFKDTQHDDYADHPDDQLDNSVNPPQDKFVGEKDGTEDVAP